MNVKAVLCLIGLSAVLLTACKHKPNDDILPSPPPATSTPYVPVIANPADSVCFSEKILPLLVSSCGKSGCHNDTTMSAGVNLTSYASVKATISGNLLMQVVQDNGSLGMPPAPLAKLTTAQVNLLQAWVNQGMKNGVDCMGPCDTTNITFSGTIFPIFQDNCIGCHSNTLPLLQNYADIKAQVNNGKILCTIKHSVGCSPMPKNTAPLSDCKIKQISNWIFAGAPNN